MKTNDRYNVTEFTERRSAKISFGVQKALKIADVDFNRSLPQVCPRDVLFICHCYVLSLDVRYTIITLLCEYKNQEHVQLKHINLTANVQSNHGTFYHAVHLPIPREVFLIFAKTRYVNTKK